MCSLPGGSRRAGFSVSFGSLEFRVDIVCRIQMLV